MKGIPRRKVLLGAAPLVLGGLSAPARLPAGRLGGRPPDRPMDDLEGRAIRRIDETGELDTLQREHLIEIDAPNEVKAGEPFQATVRLPDHPSTTEHHVAWMRVFVDDDLITFLTFAPVWQRPEVTFTFALSGGSRLDAVIECNKHDLWGMARPISVSH